MKRILSRSLMIAALFVASSPNLLAARDGAAQTFDAKGVKIHYYVEGKGEPVVLIHGLHASAKMNWDLPGVTALLAKDSQVITLDLPGHGSSDKPDKEEAYGVELAEDIVRLLDHLSIKKAHIVGYSMGGMIAAKLMAKHPDRVRSCLLGGMGWLKEGSGLQKIWEQMGSREGGRTPAECVRSLGKLALTEEELKAITVPVEVVVGDRDPVKRMYVNPLQQVRKDWPVVEIADAGHINCIMKAQFKEEIQKWLAKQTKN